MIRRFFCAFLALLLMFGGAAKASEGDFYGELVRLHVIAADDSEEEQALKLKVRDCVLEAVRPMVAECKSPEDAYAILNENLEVIEAAAQSCLMENGSANEVRTMMGVFEFPEKEYGGLTVPAGEYRALRVVIGAGEGQNWWCVLYPALCRTGEGEMYSILAAWLRSWLGGEGE